MKRGDKRSMPKAKAMTLGEFKTAFAKIKKLGWIPSKRRGDTGIGQTLEQLLGLKENNIALPDLSGAELKTHRSGSSSMITLFTFNRKAWKMRPLEAIRKYGTPDRDGRLGLYFTMSRKPNSMGLFLDVGRDSVSVQHKSGELIAEWEFESIANKFMRKIPAMILVSVFSEMRGDVEWFRYDRARLLRGTSPDIMSSEIWVGHVLLDIRLTERASFNEMRLLVDDDHLDKLFRESTTL